MNRNAPWLGAFLVSFLATGPLQSDPLILRQPLYHHQLEFCAEGASGAGKEPVTSRIFPDSRLDSAKTESTYSETVDAKEFDKPFNSSHLSADGMNGDTFTITLHRVNKPDQARAEFDHTVYQDGEIQFKFSGTTLIPMCVTPPALTATAIQEMKSLQDFFQTLHYGAVIQLTYRDGRSTKVKFHSYDARSGVAWVKPLEKGWFNSHAVHLDDLAEAHPDH